MNASKELTFDEVIAGTPGMADAIDYANRKSHEAAVAEEKRIRRNAQRRVRDQIMRDLGLVKVRGALGGVYWE